MDFRLSEEQKQIVALVDELGKKEFAPNASRWDRNHEYPWDNIHKLRECDLLGMTIPTEYGGQGRSLIDAVLAIETAAKYCGVTGKPGGKLRIQTSTCIRPRNSSPRPAADLQP